MTRADMEEIAATEDVAAGYWPINRGHGRPSVAKIARKSFSPPWPGSCQASESLVLMASR